MGLQPGSAGYFLALSHPQHTGCNTYPDRSRKPKNSQVSIVLIFLVCFFSSLVLEELALGKYQDSSIILACFLQAACCWEFPLSTSMGHLVRNRYVLLGADYSLHVKRIQQRLLSVFLINLACVCNLYTSIDLEGAFASMIQVYKGLPTIDLEISACRKRITQALARKSYNTKSAHNRRIEKEHGTKVTADDR